MSHKTSFTCRWMLLCCCWREPSWETLRFWQTNKMLLWTILTGTSKSNHEQWGRWKWKWTRQGKCQLLTVARAQLLTFFLSPPPPRCILYELFPHDSSRREKSVCKLCDDDFRENLLKCISYVNERNISIYSLIVELCWAYCVELKIAFNPLALSDFRWFSFHQFPYEMACAHKLRQLRLKTHQTWRERRAL